MFGHWSQHPLHFSVQYLAFWSVFCSEIHFKVCQCVFTKILNLPNNLWYCIISFWRDHIINHNWNWFHDENISKQLSFIFTDAAIVPRRVECLEWLSYTLFFFYNLWSGCFRYYSFISVLWVERPTSSIRRFTPTHSTVTDVSISRYELYYKTRYSSKNFTIEIYMKYLSCYIGASFIVKKQSKFLNNRWFMFQRNDGLRLQFPSHGHHHNNTKHRCWEKGGRYHIWWKRGH